MLTIAGGIIIAAIIIGIFVGGVLLAAHTETRADFLVSSALMIVSIIAAICVVFPSVPIFVASFVLSLIGLVLSAG